MHSIVIAMCLKYMVIFFSINFYVMMHGWF